MAAVTLMTGCSLPGGSGPLNLLMTTFTPLISVPGTAPLGQRRCPKSLSANRSTCGCRQAGDLGRLSCRCSMRRRRTRRPLASIPAPACSPQPSSTLYIDDSDRRLLRSHCCTTGRAAERRQDNCQTYRRVEQALPFLRSPIRKTIAVGRSCTQVDTECRNASSSARNSGR